MTNQTASGEIIRENHLRERFWDLLEHAQAIDIAVAWATEWPIDEILARAPQLRAVIGVDGNATRPEALWRIKRHGQLRIGHSDTGIFHTKLMLFHCDQATTCWIGSANLTTNAFFYNTELVYSFQDTGSARDTFEQIWNTSRIATEELLNKYGANWSPPARPRRQPKSTPQTASNPPFTDLLQAADSPDSFWEALQQCDRRWRDRTADLDVEEFGVLGDPICFEDTIRTGNAILREGFHPDSMPKADLDFLAGDAPGAALLGDLRAAAQVSSAIKGTAGSRNSAIREALTNLVDALSGVEGDDFIDHAPRHIAQALEVPHVGLHTVTRFLTFLRPDVAVVVNGQNADAWHAVTGLPRSVLRNGGSTSRTAEVYGELLTWVRNARWNRARPKQNSSGLDRVWSLRGGLLDAFVYTDHDSG